MTSTSAINYKEIANIFKNNGLSVEPAEIHGLLTGFLCAGISPDEEAWKVMLYDYTNEGADWPIESQTVAANLIKASHDSISSSDMAFNLLLPDEKASLFAHADALSEWVNCFIAGLGLGGISSKDCTEDCHEILSDLAEIAQLGVDEDDDLEEQADIFKEVIEHVRVCVMTLHLEFSQKRHQVETQKPTLH